MSLFTYGGINFWMKVAEIQKKYIVSFNWNSTWTQLKMFTGNSHLCSKTNILDIWLYSISIFVSISAVFIKSKKQIFGNDNI